MFIRDYFVKNNQSKAIVALSGGIDSALVSALVIDALGVENVKLVTLPSKFTSDTSYSDANHFIDSRIMLNS